MKGFWLIWSFFVYLCILSSQGKAQEYLRNNDAHDEAGENFMEETLELLKLGDELIELRDEYKEVILILGNTGSGKSTLAKFLTGDNSKLISYWAGDRFLIYDEDGDISVNSTIISKTLFPQLMIHNETDTAFYDLPGFSDTRNVSIEIANAVFMKKVADFAEKVKLVFVVDYFSLRSGGSRNDLISMLKQAADFVKDMKKFEPAISLVASKVESAQNDEVTIKGIVSFLETVIQDMPNVIEDPAVLADCIDLVSIWRTPGNASFYPRVSLFRSPLEEGPLSDIPGVMNSKPKIEDTIWVQTEYVPTSEGDFGLSLSDKAKLVVLELVVKINEDIGSILGDLSTLLENYFLGLYDSLEGELYKNMDIAKKQYLLYLHLFQTVSQDEVQSRAEFLEILQETFEGIIKLNNNSLIQQSEKLVDQILKSGGYLDLLEEVSKAARSTVEPLRILPLEWLYPLERSDKGIRETLTNFAGKAIDKYVRYGAFTIGGALEGIFYGAYVPPLTPELKTNLEADAATLATLIGEINACKTLRCFTTANFGYLLTGLTVSVPASVLNGLPGEGVDVDLVDLEMTPYNPPGWKGPYDKALQVLQSLNA